MTKYISKTMDMIDLLLVIRVDFEKTFFCQAKNFISNFGLICQAIRVLFSV